MNRDNAIEILKKELRDYSIKPIGENKQAYFFLCEAPSPDLIPSKLAAAVNKETMAIGVSLKGYEDAIKNATK